MEGHETQLEAQSGKEEHHRHYLERGSGQGCGDAGKVGGTGCTVYHGDAIKHQGVASAQVGQKLLSVEKVAEDAGESRNQIKRYIRLTYLIPELLAMVDDGKIAFNPAVEISYLSKDEQRILLDAMDLNDCTPSHAQSIRLKKLSQEGSLDSQIIYGVMSEEKPNQKEQIKFKRDDFKKYFPPNYTDEQMRKDILKGLELLRKQRERNRDTR